MKIILTFQTADGVNIRYFKLFYQTENRKYIGIIRITNF